MEIKPSLQVQLKSKSGFVFRQHNFWGNGQYDVNPFEKQSMQNTKRVCCAALGQCEGIFFKFEILITYFNFVDGPFSVKKCLMKIFDKVSMRVTEINPSLR